MDVKLKVFLLAMASFVAAFLGAAYWEWQCQRADLLERASELDENLRVWEKQLHLLGRMSVLENGLRFGGGLMVERVLDQTVFGEASLRAVAVFDEKGLFFSGNTHTSEGLYQGTEGWLGAVSPQQLEQFPQGAWGDWQRGDGWLLVQRVAVESDDEPVGWAVFFLDAQRLLRRPPGLELRGLRVKNATEMAEGRARFDLLGSLSEAPGMFLMLPVSVWGAVALQSGTLAGSAAVCVCLFIFWIGRSIGRRRQEQSELYQQALQVAHDIRSPVNALATLQRASAGLGYEERQVLQLSVQRIHDISEDLLLRYRRRRERTFSLVGPAACRAILESRVAHEWLGPSLTVDASESDWAVSTSLPPEELDRILVTLIQNAVEAADSQRPCVRVRWGLSGQSIELHVSHNGITDRRKVLSHQLGGRFVRKTLGSLWTSPERVTDKNGQTWVVVRVALPQATTPYQVLGRLRFASGGKVVLFDDDRCFAERFRQRLAGKARDVLIAQSPQELLGLQDRFDEGTEFFVDFRISGFGQSGPELLRVLPVTPAVLVTSFPEDPAVVRAAAVWGAPVLPKDSFEFVPIERWERRKSVLVDDDALTRKHWALAAQRANVSLMSFVGLSEFQAQKHSLDPDSEIYIDGSLLLQQPQVLDELHREGFEHLFLTTGHGDLSLLGLGASHRRVRDKTPPWLRRCDGLPSPETRSMNQDAVKTGGI